MNGRKNLDGRPFKEHFHVSREKMRPVFVLRYKFCCPFGWRCFMRSGGRGGRTMLRSDYSTMMNGTGQEPSAVSNSFVWTSIRTPGTRHGRRIIRYSDREFSRRIPFVEPGSHVSAMDENMEMLANVPRVQYYQKLFGLFMGRSATEVCV